MKNIYPPRGGGGEAAAPPGLVYLFGRYLQQKRYTHREEFPRGMQYYMHFVSKILTRGFLLARKLPRDVDSDNAKPSSLA